MTTIELFRADPYRRSWPGRVAAATPDSIVLDQTCLAPCAVVGPPGDLGWIGAHRVVSVTRNSNAQLVHQLEDFGTERGAEPPATGDQVTCRLDWPHRYAAMRQHTAGHLVELGLYTTHGVTSTTTRRADGRLSLRPAESLRRLDLAGLRSWIALVVDDDLPMVASADLATPHRWVWHMDGYGQQCCDGLHVRSTGEVGEIAVEPSADFPDELVVSLPLM